MTKILFLFFTMLFADSIYQNRLGNHVESYRLRTRSLIDSMGVNTEILPSYEDQIRKFLKKKSFDIQSTRPSPSRKRRNLKMRFLKRF